MRKIDQKQRNSGNNNNNNGIIPSSIRSFSSYLRIVSSGASTVASTVRSAASSAIVDRDSDSGHDQVLWAGFDKLSCEDGTSHRVLLLGYQHGFQVWDVEYANNVRNIVSRFDGPVSFMQILAKPNDHPLLVLCGGPSVSDGNINSGYMPTVVWFYSFKSRSYIKELKFRSVVYSVRCSSRIVAVLQAAQIHCFDAATLEREYTILTNPVATSSSRFESIGLGPLAMGPRWMAYSGSMVTSPNTCVSPQHLTGPKSLTTSGSNGSIVAHYAKQSSKQLAVGIVTLGDIGYKKLSRYYLPDGNISQQVNDTGRLPDTENIGMVIVRDVMSKSVIAQFKAHDSPVASLCFDPSGILLVTASVHGHSFNVFRIGPGPANGASYTHLYRLQRGFTNAVIQDISFSFDSRWITISSSRGTSHLFAVSPTGGPVSMQSGEEYAYDAASKPPVTLSAVGRIRSGNSVWRNMVNGSAVIASTFHKCKGKNDPDLDSGNPGPAFSNYYMLVFSSSGSVIQYALRVSSEVDSVYESSLDNSLKLTVDPIQKWHIFNKQNRREREREEYIDIYGENAHIDNRKVFPEKTDCFEGASKIKKESVNAEERNHVYISEAELQMHALQTPLWAKPQICFQSLTIDDDLINVSEIENIPTRTVEVKSTYLIPAVDYLREPKVQTTSVPALDDNNNNNDNNVLDEHEKFVTHEPRTETEGGLEKGDEETGEDDGVVNSDSCPVSHTRPETVDNIQHSVSGTRSELVNSDIGQKLENHFEDQGAEFD
ncbi:autophagy-related protein 18f-like [Bidens hawaiensis]|uniref:autophagy-related protein 18f-like n=1 Tax=Bidens hawaiensis TaxID=980011 RepID=UPI004048F8D6